ncbi:MAG TPA: ATP-binding protein [Candidatus Obscuribacterales bacterium]
MFEPSSRLYRQVYLYVIAIFLLSLMLTGLTMGLFFNQREQGLIAMAFRHQVQFFRRELLRTERQSPEQLPAHLKELGEQLGWDVAYWRQGRLIFASVSKAPELASLDLPALRAKGHLQLGPPPQVVVPLYPRQPERGILWLRLKLAALEAPLRGPLLALGLVLLFLGLLLLPLTRFLLRPYRALQTSLQHVAEGDFDYPLEEKRYPAFQELVKTFNLMRARLQQMMQQKQRLVADVSHELRSPLTRLRVILELLDRQPGEAGLIGRAVDEIEELDRIIEDVLEISRLQLHSMPLRREPLDLTWLLFEVCEQHQPLLEAKGLELEVSMPHQPVRLMADARLLKRVFNNLFVNLSKYVPGPGMVDLELSEGPDQLLIRLRDRGPGLPQAELAEIFTPFYRLDPSRSRRTGGVGLGLAIVWEIIQAHQGSIQARLPADGPGLEFLISLPKQPAPQLGQRDQLNK